MFAILLKFGLWTSARWVVASVLSLTSALALLANFGLILKARKSQNRESFAPLIGGLASAIAVVVLPIDGAVKWVWLPLVLDFTWLIAALSVLGSLLRISQTASD